MILKLSAGFVVLLIAAVLQFFFASAEILLNFSFAALITFAFVFGFWELLVLVIFTVFIANWQPGPSVEIFILAAFPLAVYFCRNLLRWKTWLENFLAIALGYLLLYCGAAPARILHEWPSLLANIAAGILFSALIFFPLYRWGKE